MSMIDVVRADMVAAMKAKEKEKKEVLSMLLADLKNYEINNVIEIFPMVSLVVKINDIDQLNIKLKTYKSKEDDEDETDED